MSKYNKGNSSFVIANTSLESSNDEFYEAARKGSK